MFLRIIFIFKTAIISSFRFSNEDNDCARGIKNKKKITYYESCWHHLKLKFFALPFRIILCLYCFTTLIFAYFLRIFESPYYLSTNVQVSYLF